MKNITISLIIGLVLGYLVAVTNQSHFQIASSGLGITWLVDSKTGDTWVTAPATKWQWMYKGCPKPINFTAEPIDLDFLPDK